MQSTFSIYLIQKWGGGGDMQTHSVWARVSEVCLRWIQIHDDLHKTQSASETQGGIPEYF